MFTASGLADLSITLTVKVVDPKIELIYGRSIQEHLTIAGYVRNTNRSALLIYGAGFSNIKSNLK